MNKLIKSILALSFVFVLFTVALCAQENTELKEVPEYTLKFTKEGMKITSDDQEFLHAIEQIQMEEYNYFVTDSLVVFDSYQWQINEKELVIHYSVYQDKDVQVNVHYQVTVLAKGYAESQKVEHLSSYTAEVQMTMNPQGEIILNCEDEKWIQSVYQSQNESFLDVNYDLHHSCSDIPTSELIFEADKIVVSVPVQEKYRIYAGNTYLFEVDAAGKYAGITLGTLTITRGRSDAVYEDLMQTPVFGVGFEEFGLYMISENLEYLNSIDRIECINDSEGIHLSFVKSQWEVKGNELVMPCAEYFEQGAKRNVRYRIVVSAKGYHDANRYDSLYWSSASDVQVDVNEAGDIVITSSDRYWLRMLAEDVNDSAIKINKNPSYFHCNIANTDLIFEDNQIRITPSVQRKHRMYTGKTYLIGSSVIANRYYYQELGEATVTHGMLNLPSDAKISQNSQGQIEITSSDQNWLEKIVSYKTETGKSSVVMTMDSKEKFEFYNDEYQKDLVLQDGKIIIDSDTFIKKGLLPGYIYCEVNAVPYESFSDYLGITQLPIPEDVQIIVEKTTGELRITSSDLNWLKSLVELRDEYAAVYVTKASGDTWFWNTQGENDLMLEGNQVVIYKEAQRKRGLVQGETVQFQFYSDVYGYSDLYEVTVGKGGCIEYPDDIQVIVESNGNIVIKSSDLNWLKSLTELHDDEYATVYITRDSGNTWFWNDSNETDLYFDGNRVVIKPEAQQRRGLIQNEIIQLYFFSYEYGPTEDFQIQIGTGGLKKTPDDLTVGQNSQGDLLIQTSDQEYLNTLLEGTVEFISEELGVKWFFYREDMKKGSEILISVELMKERGLINGEYDVELSASGYPKETFNGQLMNLKDRNPNQVNIVFDENEGIIISCQSSEYIQSITHVEMAPVNGNQAYIYDDTQGIREELRYVIPIEEMIKDGVNPDTYSIYVLSEIYGIESYRLELNSEVFKVNDVVRIKGQTRFETSLKIADALKETLELDKFDVVILANGRDFADALAGSVLAISQKAPILMVDSKNNNMTQIMDYLSENMKSDGKIYILGGEAAVPAWAEETLNNAGIVYERIKGKNRYGTNLAILEKADVNSEIILVCNGKSFADSLSASATGYPMLLVGSSLNDEQKAYLQKNTGKQYVILGGTGAVSSGIEEALKSYGTVERVYGTTRYETSIEIAKRFFRDSDKAVLAYAKNYPDGLCGGTLAYYMNAPLILTANGNYSAAQNYLNEKIVQRGAVLGGVSLISDETVKELLLKLPVLK